MTSFKPVNQFLLPNGVTANNFISHFLRVEHTFDPEMKMHVQSEMPLLLVLEIPVRSSYLVPSGPNRDQDQLVLPTQKLKITRPDQYKPVSLVMHWLQDWLLTGLGYVWVDSS